MFWVRTHSIDNYTFVTVVDKELLGKKFEEGGVILHIDEEFFKGELMDEESLLKKILNATSIYVIGKRAVKVALKAGIIHPQAIKSVKGIPHAQSISVMI